MTNHTGHSTGTSHRTRLPKVLDIARQTTGQRFTPKQLVELLDGLEIQIVNKQGAPSWAFKALGDPEGPYPGRFKGTEAISDDGLTSLINYLTATSPEAA